LVCFVVFGFFFFFLRFVPFGCFGWALGALGAGRVAAARRGDRRVGIVCARGLGGSMVGWSRRVELGVVACACGLGSISAGPGLCAVALVAWSCASCMQTCGLGAEWWGGPVVLQLGVDVCACGLDFRLGFGSRFVYARIGRRASPHAAVSISVFVRWRSWPGRVRFFSRRVRPSRIGTEQGCDGAVSCGGKLAVSVYRFPALPWGGAGIHFLSMF
jgi:hypothetical protein